ncbi:MarR family winged helix-turn-helix transcriptional regulator [Ethanoligenens harbinense]|uniref:Transcriptional regulator, MarR family n=1 Tax=Ethanoligenens harbinense (strain DSM 18485 / JCM 12961 / CGMCC 1.5033 / YUAN-3) TaxID=663278 RepID=E6U5D5_ETHHY|nr:MarR family transcriptional regulator [Ethanoligenens harbinense]ADU25602.1 transcriptional regulator, MarR family [Ethanoligenens harbinense YUAN-3]AVQ94779.1 MarR family transcriptional regulator [Ethanoligenens harbinense YUAN-3]AYF37471.1 MarR family transcriptional regulator [Ethanoligenens harbinense]AYF40190.1 MarR family transcriptional regulator [Ethanoligenens harbinense]QCN91026.1 MarR family transcriptional regulator [Ethanoligenens harbinense]
MDISDGLPLSGESSGYLFSQTYNRWHTEIKKRLRKMEITHPQFSVLASLDCLTQQKAFATQAEIAKRAGMDVMTVCGIIHTLEGKRFLKRTANPNDARASAVYLLEKGRMKLEEAFPAVRQIDEEFFGRLGDARATFNALLAVILSEQPGE